MVNLTFPNGEKKEYPDDMTGLELAGKISTSLAKEAIAIKINDKVFDLSSKIKYDAHIKILTAKDPEGIDVIRHSCSHLMAQAIHRIFPKAVPTIGPIIEDGFYYDFDNLTIKEEDLSKIETEMQKISKENIPVKRIELTKAKALKQFPNPFKQELIKELEDGNISAYEQGDFIDLCTGPHVPSTGFVKHFKLLKIAGSYWRGDAKNKMLTRIYGTAWASDKDLKEYLHRLEEAEKRDHRKLGRELDLWGFYEESPGAAYFHPKGTIIYNELQSFLREQYRIRGFQEVITPLLYDKSLWEKSGHWKHFKEDMFVITIDGREFSLKPMNCPSHILYFMNSTRSYRDLPLAITDFAALHRNELRGVLSGLTRVRKFEQDDGHIFITPEQTEEEFMKVIEFCDYVYKDIFNFKYKIGLATRNPEKFLGTIDEWNNAESTLRKVLEKSKKPFFIKEGDAAFYAPKLDFQFEDSLGRTHQLATIQLDFNMPRQFNATYEGKDGKKHTPYMIHRAVLGSLERFLGVYTEHVAGAFPFWLSPVQVVLMTLSDEQKQYAEEVRKKLFDAGIRVDVDDRVETIGKKVREAQIQKIPFMITLGAKEAEQKTVAVRTRDGQVKFGVSADEFVKKCHEMKTTRSLQTSI